MASATPFPKSALPSKTRLRFHEATGLTHELLEGLQHNIRDRVLRHFRCHGHLEPHEAEEMLTWDHGGGLSLDASVRIVATDRAGRERLIRYCARGPPQTEFAMGPNGRQVEEVVQESQESFPDDLDQTTPLDLAQPEPIPHSPTGPRTSHGPWSAYP